MDGLARNEGDARKCLKDGMSVVTFRTKGCASSTSLSSWVEVILDRVITLEGLERGRVWPPGVRRLRMNWFVFGSGLKHQYQFPISRLRRGTRLRFVSFTFFGSGG